MDGDDLGSSLRALRTARGLSIGEAARRAGVPRPTLSAWESETTRPRGPALVRLLDALESAPRLRARLLHAADPAHARIDLASGPFGAPVDVGMVVRAMRGRRGMTQADLARAAGVAQATVARWESGDAAPGGEALHRACFALGASVEELAALAYAQGDSLGEMPNEPEAAWRYIVLLLGPMPEAIREVVALGVEAELWRRSVRDPRWDPVYCNLLSGRANELFCAGRLGEVEETARRALRRATSPESRTAATMAVSALVALARHAEAPPAPLAARLQGWIERLPKDCGLRGYMIWERARLLAQSGEEAEALEDLERVLELHWSSGKGSDEGSMGYNARKYQVELWLETSRPERAVDFYPSLERIGPGADSPTRLMVIIPAWHAARQPVPERYLDEYREWVLGGPGDSWILRERLAKMEREQARLLAAP